MSRFVKPYMEIVTFGNVDVIATSGGNCEICDGYDCGSTDGKTCCQGDWAH